MKGSAGMVKFRFHRGGLKEAMETVVEVSTRKELVDHINKEYEGCCMPTLELDEMKIEPYGYDDRIDWDTYVVVGKIPKQGAPYTEKTEDYVIGFTNGPME